MQQDKRNRIKYEVGRMDFSNQIFPAFIVTATNTIKIPFFTKGERIHFEFNPEKQCFSIHSELLENSCFKMCFSALKNENEKFQNLLKKTNGKWLLVFQNKETSTIFLIKKGGSVKRKTITLKSEEEVKDRKGNNAKTRLLHPYFRQESMGR